MKKKGLLDTRHVLAEWTRKKCSGLEIEQYAEASMSSRFEVFFERIRCIDEDRITLFNTVQNFLFCSIKKK
jgi:hypothetical protein